MTAPSRGELLAAARALPDSGLKSAIVATLSEREPSRREVLAWASAIQRQAEQGA